MLSAGGLASTETAGEFPVRLIESGPVAGAIVARQYAAQMGRAELLSFDMGGTTAKSCLIRDAVLPITDDLEVARSRRFTKSSGYPLAVPAAHLLEIGAGGGSIASVNAMGLLQVGPGSAGADPGPICYGRGGTRPTVTDADLLLGYLNPEDFAGGAVRLDPEEAARAIEERIAHPLGLSLEDAAWGVHAMVNTNMELATRVVSIERGRDPRDLTLVAFGGSGPVHGCRLAQALGIPRVILPAAAGVTAAIGLLAAEVKFDVARTYVRRLDAADPAYLSAMYEEMAGQAIDVVRESAVAGEVTVARWADARYVGQGYELTVPVPPGRLDAAALARVRASFDDIYAARYGYANQGEPVEIVTWKLSALGGSPRIALAKAAARPGDGSRKGVRRAYFPEARGYAHTPVYDRYALAPGMSPTGPALLEEREATTVIPAEATAP